MRVVLLALLLVASVSHASPFGGSTGVGILRFDGYNARTGAGGHGLAMALNIRPRPALDVGLRFNYALIDMETLDRVGRVMHIGVGAELDVTPRFSVGGGAALALFSTTPHEQSMSRGFVVPVRASFYLAAPLRLAIEMQPTFFQGGFALSTMFLVEVAR
jgi:hypothetical protein